MRETRTPYEPAPPVLADLPESPHAELCIATASFMATACTTKAFTASARRGIALPSTSTPDDGAMPHTTTAMFQARPGYASGALCFAGTKIRVETLFQLTGVTATPSTSSRGVAAWLLFAIPPVLNAAHVPTASPQIPLQRCRSGLRYDAADGTGG